MGSDIEILGRKAVVHEEDRPFNQVRESSQILVPASPKTGVTSFFDQNIVNQSLEENEWSTNVYVRMLTEIAKNEEYSPKTRMAASDRLLLFIEKTMTYSGNLRTVEASMSVRDSGSNEIRKTITEVVKSSRSKTLEMLNSISNEKLNQLDGEENGNESQHKPPSIEGTGNICDMGDSEPPSD